VLDADDSKSLSYEELASGLKKLKVCEENLILNYHTKYLVLNFLFAGAAHNTFVRGRFSYDQQPKVLFPSHTLSESITS
jgi:hypothetical protein